MKQTPRQLSWSNWPTIHIYIHIYMDVISTEQCPSNMFLLDIHKFMFMSFLLFAWNIFPCVSLVSVYSSLVQYDDKRYNMLSIEFQLAMLGFLQKSD